MRSLLDRAFSAVLHHSAPEQNPAFFVGSLEFQPHIERVHGAAGEKMPDIFGAHDDVDPHVIAAAHGGVHAAEWRRDRPGFPGCALRQGDFRFFSNGKGC